jgi:hypothetical protein
MPAPIRVLITGSREWSDPGLLAMRLRWLPKTAIVVHGACHGADLQAEARARGLGLATERHPVTDEEWRKVGKSAGIRRNERMLDAGADLVLAFAVNIETSRGTRHCAGEAIKRGYPVELFELSPKPRARYYNGAPLYRDSQFDQDVIARLNDPFDG